MNDLDHMKHLIQLIESAEQLDELLVRLSSDKKFTEIETYKNYRIFITKEKFKDRYFITKAAYENGETFKAGDQDVKASGETRPEAIQAIKDQIDYFLNAQKVDKRATIDFNVEFVKQLMLDPRIPFYAKFSNIEGNPVLVVAGDELLEFGDEITQLGFKRSSLRINPDGESDSTPLPSMSFTAKQIKPAGLIANGRYLVGDARKDSDGNPQYSLTYHSTVHTKSDKRYINAPALTVGSER